MTDTASLAALLDRLDAEVRADTDSGSWRNGAQYVIDEVRALASTPLSSGRANLGGSGDGYGTNAATEPPDALLGIAAQLARVETELEDCREANKIMREARATPDALDDQPLFDRIRELNAEVALLKKEAREDRAALRAALQPKEADR